MYFLSLTLWKFYIFAATQILREIKSKDFRSSKIAILTLLEALNLDFSDLMLFARGENYHTQDSEPVYVKTAKIAIFEPIESP